VVLLARTSKAAGRLSAQFRAGEIAKVYWAIVEGCPEPAVGEWEDRVEKDLGLNRVRVLENATGEGQLARMTFRVIERGGGWSKLELRPATGRSHQLRVQLAHRGLPIVGDRKYGAATFLEAGDGRRRIALHARELSFTHPTRGEVLTILAPVPADWPAIGTGKPERPTGPSRPGEREACDLDG
jgi:23S rRNA pseudouridine1911/1915/1917 synthase